MRLALPSAVLAHKTQTLELKQAAAREAVRAWGRISPSRIAESWQPLAAALAERVTELQARAATSGILADSSALAAQGQISLPQALASPRGAAGWLIDAEDLDVAYALPDVLATAPVRRAKMALAEGASPRQALTVGRQSLTSLVSTAVSDAARTAQAVDIAARPHVSYIRVVTMPACSRCIQLAGRIYRWNRGFQRHPYCDCQHLPTTHTSYQAARDAGLAQDPYELFSQLTPEQQDKAFGQHNAQAIRDGADIHQVINSARGRSRDRWKTREGTTRRAAWRRDPGRIRMTWRPTPEAIYRRWGDDRARILSELDAHGYITRAGQIPGGAYQGADYQGFGQYGRGGTRAAATGAVLDAAATGQRTGSIYTATAAEQRLAAAARDWDLVRQGVHPASDLALVMRGAPRISAANRPISPAEAAQYEQTYRLMLAAGGSLTDYRRLRRLHAKTLT